MYVLLSCIVPTAEPAVNVSFSQRQYRVKEGDMLVVQFVVLGSSVTPAEVRVTSVNGTAFSKFYACFTKLLCSVITSVLGGWL